EECTACRILRQFGFTDKEAESYLVTVSDRNTGRVLVSPVTRKIIVRAEELAEKDDALCGSIHILLSACLVRTSLAAKILAGHKIDYDRILSVAEGIKNYDPEPKQVAMPKKTDVHAQNTPISEIESFGEFLTEKARKNELEPFFGREKVLERILRVLSRKNKNNPMLVGESGVGKTAVVEGLAQLAVGRSAPDFLRNKEIFSLNVGSLLSGTRYRGDLEEKVGTLLKNLRGKNVILFIDEAHVLLSGGGSDQNVTLSSLLKPALCGDIPVVGATTFDEYTRYIERDPAFERRFTKVIVPEMTIDETNELILRKKAGLEKHFGLSIDKKAATLATDLSVRYLSDGFLPDKAIDLTEEAFAKAKAEQKKKVTEEDVRYVLSERTGIPVNKLTIEERKRALQIEEELKKRVMGQPEAIDKTASAIRRTYAGLKDEERPYSFLFIGPTGVGKTETAKTLAEVLFGNENELIRFDMSEFSEKNSVAKLIGSPPGYVGYEEGGRLTEAVRKKPYSVLLLDEIEKADASVYSLLLQLLDDGRLTDAKGKTVDFSHVIVIMTGNIGVKNRSKNKGSVGFITAEKDDKEGVFSELKSILPPEFINRINNIIIFDDLSKEILPSIANKLLERIKRTLLHERGIELDVSKSVLTYLADRGYDKEYGARPLRRLIEREIEDELSRYLLETDPKNCSLTITLCGNKPQIRKKRRPKSHACGNQRKKLSPR
ncbi:MAG: ATP-dependent Clp protease ATP-binding subunit, partial [Clostridia bacterium]|nr:ATP-dependent Clp protease ATP-binding subunit [Clostridia bacterium]